MKTFALDKNYSQFNFDEISVDELEIISGGTGVASANDSILSHYSSYYSVTAITTNGVTQNNSNKVTYSYSYVSTSGQTIQGGGTAYA